MPLPNVLSHNFVLVSYFHSSDWSFAGRFLEFGIFDWNIVFHFLKFDSPVVSSCCPHCERHFHAAHIPIVIVVDLIPNLSSFGVKDLGFRDQQPRTSVEDEVLTAFSRRSLNNKSFVITNLLFSFQFHFRKQSLES